MSEKLLLSVREAAERLSLGKTTVYEMINRGELPALRIGTQLRVSVHDLETWIGEQERVYSTRPGSYERMATRR